MASRNLLGAVSVFTEMDTRKQAQVIRRVGIDSVEADHLFFNLRANHPERFSALSELLGEDMA